MIYDLLPSAEYYKHSAGFFEDLSNISTPQIPGYDSDQALLSLLGKNVRLLNQAALSHTDDLDNMNFSSTPYNVSSIVGCGLFTEKTVNKMYNGDPTFLQRAAAGPKYRVEGDSGDGTVLMQSAVHDGGMVYYAPKVSHSDLLSDPNTSAAIVSLLNGTSPDPAHTPNADSVGNSCNVSGKILSFSSNVNVVLKNKTTGATLVPQRDYHVIQTGNDRHIFIPSDQLPSYSVQIQDQVTGGTSENISITNSSSTKTDNHNTYNYNNQKLDANLLAITFPTVTSGDTSGQDVENVDPSSGDVTTIQPSDELDGSYNDIPGTSSASDTTSSQTSTQSSDDSSTTSTTSTNGTNSGSNNTTTTTNQTSSDSAGTSDNTISTDTGTDTDTNIDPNTETSSSTGQTVNPQSSTNDSSNTAAQTKTIYTPDGEAINITINNTQPAQPAANSAHLIQADPPSSDEPTEPSLPFYLRVLQDIHKVIFSIFF
jgi:hypothetical protein